MTPGQPTFSKAPVLTVGGFLISKGRQNGSGLQGAGHTHTAPGVHKRPQRSHGNDDWSNQRTFWGSWFAWTSMAVAD